MLPSKIGLIGLVLLFIVLAAKIGQILTQITYSKIIAFTTCWSCYSTSLPLGWWVISLVCWLIFRTQVTYLVIFWFYYNNWKSFIWIRCWVHWWSSLEQHWTSTTWHFCWIEWNGTMSLCSFMSQLHMRMN